MRISDRLAPWIEESVERYALGDNVSWELTMLPTQGGLITGVIFYLPSMILGEILTGVTPINNAVTISPDEIDAIVHGSLEQMRQSRSQTVVESNGDGPHFGSI
jgi:hypothetical protein